MNLNSENLRHEIQSPKINAGTPWSKGAKGNAFFAASRLCDFALKMAAQF
jgi:hypothetical protein